MDHFYYNLLQLIVFGKRYITYYKVTIVSNILVEKKFRFIEWELYARQCLNHSFYQN